MLDERRQHDLFHLPGSLISSHCPTIIDLQTFSIKSKTVLKASHAIWFLHNHVTIDDTDTNIQVPTKMYLQEWAVVLIWFVDFWKKGRKRARLHLSLSSKVKSMNSGPTVKLTRYTS